MASSGSFTGSRGGSSTGPYLTLDWDIIDTDIGNNKTKVRLTLKLHSDYYINFSANKSGNLEGTSFTYSGGMNGAGTVTVKTKDMWITHDADGSKSYHFDSSFNIAIYWGSSYVSSLSVSGTAVLNTIPRASDFSISGSTIGSAVTVSISRASSSFTHTVIYDLPSGSRRASFTGITTSKSFTPSMADCQYIPNSTSATAKITVQTYNGSSYIGSKARTFTLNVPSSVVPSASGLSVSIYGSGKDKSMNKYIQSVSKVTASFSASSVYGATISASHITVRRQSDNADSQTIGSKSGTTSGTVNLSGNYEIIAWTQDSRGRTATTSAVIYVYAYSVPTISKFDLNRSSVLTSSVIADILATWTPLSGLNSADVSIVGTNNTGVNQTLYTLNDSTAGTLSTTQTYSGQSDASSYSYTITVTDEFGKKATATVKVGTSFIELTISKGKGVGIGKVHEQGALDIRGEIHVDGTIHMPPNSYRSTTNGGGLDANNGDIYGLNGIWFGINGDDIANNGGEGLIFPRDSTPIDSTSWADYDNFRLNNGTGYLNGQPMMTSDDPVLWEGAAYMYTGQQVKPTKKMSECPNGWVLVWSRYSSGVQYNDNIAFSFIPKWRASKIGGNGGIGLVLRDNTHEFSTKYVYVQDDIIEGNDVNETTPNNYRVLIAVWTY